MPGAVGGVRPQQTVILPGSVRPAERWYHRPRFAVLAVSGALILIAAAIFGVTRIGENNSSQGTGHAAAVQATGGHGAAARKAPPLKPSSITVAVLNGTTVPGLARKIGDRIESLGFQLGNVTNDANQQRQESVVLYRIGHEREARLVGRRLGIPQRERIDPSTQALAGDATVVVVSGGDQSR